MCTMTIDGRKVEFTDEKNVLTVIRNAGINIPTLCYHSEVSTFGACRLCTVEDDRGKTFASCSEQPRDGMVIYTNSGRIKKYRKLIVELLLAAHCRDCTTCVKSGECILQELAHRLGVRNIRFENTREQHEIDMMFFMLTNILTESTDLICTGQGAEQLIANAFHVKDEDMENVSGQTGIVKLPGVVSRKKQLAPQIMMALQ